MAIFEVKVPQLSESVAEATLLQWKKKVGDAVGQDEILIEIETDKVVLEVPAPSAGVITEIVVADGGTVVAEQLIRPTGITEPKIIVKPVATQVKDVLERVRERIENGQRALITTLTKKMAEELTEYLNEQGIAVQYIHSDVDNMERLEILRDLRLGKYDVLIGINLLREGLDLPEVSLVAILDADKEGFLRSETALTQTMGRAARRGQGCTTRAGDRPRACCPKPRCITGRSRAGHIKGAAGWRASFPLDWPTPGSGNARQPLPATCIDA